jgi:hypothetical protein
MSDCAPAVGQVYDRQQNASFLPFMPGHVIHQFMRLPKSLMYEIPITGLPGADLTRCSRHPQRRRRSMPTAASEASNATPAARQADCLSASFTNGFEEAAGARKLTEAIGHLYYSC